MMKLFKKTKTFFGLLFGGRKYFIYDKVFLHNIPKWRGKACLNFYSWIYPNIHIGNGIQCWGDLYIFKTPESEIRMGNKLHIVSDFKRAGIALFTKVKMVAYFNSKIVIGNNVGLNGTSITCRTTTIEIGDGTIIAPNVIIVDSDFHRLWPSEDRTNNMGYENDRPVKIKSNVWIGMNSIILKGVTIGENSIIGAGSVVVKDIPPNVIAAGNPCKVIRELV